jgi:hypothetical protein
MRSEETAGTAKLDTAKTREIETLSVDPDDCGGAEAESDLSGLSGEEIVTDIRRNISCISFCHARVIALIDEAERRGLWAEWVGVKTLPEWVMHVASVSMHTAREYVRVMTALREMPKVNKSLAAGEVSFSKVREVTRIGERIGDEEALRLATLATGSQISRICRDYQQLSAEIESGPLPVRLPQDCVTMRQVAPGRTRITIDLEEDEAAELFTMLDSARHVLEQREAAGQRAAADGAGAEDRSEDEDEVSHEPISQVMCLMEIVHAFPRAEQAGAVDADRARMLIHASAEVVTRAGAVLSAGGTGADVPAGTLPDAGACAETTEAGAGEAGADTTCRIEGFGGITAATAERLSCEALISGVIKGADGDVLMLGRSKRLVSRRQRLALSVRDACCQFPGCRSRRRCDAHHIRPWSQGGATDLDNLILLCRRHHTVVHKHQLRIERTGAAFAGAMQGPAAFAFSLPDGSQLLPLESRARGRAMFDTAVQVARIEAATADADPGTVGGGYGFDRDFCIAWMFEAESRHARESNAVV